MSGPTYAGAGPTYAGPRLSIPREEPIAATPAERAADRQAQLRGAAEQLEVDAKALARTPAKDWIERKQALDRRLADLRARAVSTTGGSAETLRGEEGIAAVIMRVETLLAAASPPPAIPPLPGEPGIRPAIEDRSAEAGDVLEWVSTLPHADRRTLWSRYERASSGGRAADAPADDFARSLANYVAEVRIRKDLKAIVDMSDRRARQWREENRRRAAIADDVEDDVAPPSPSSPAGPATEIGAMATDVERAVAKTLAPFGADQPQVEVAKALRALAAAIDRAPATLTPTDRAAIERALRAAETYGRMHGPGPGRAVHEPLLAVQGAAQRHGFTIDVIIAAAISDDDADLGKDDQRDLTARSVRQVDRARDQLRAWGLDAEADALGRGALLLSWGANTAGGLSDEARRRAVLQSRTLFEAAGEIDAHIAMAEAAGAGPGTAEWRVFAKVVSAYAHAIARSSLDPDPLAAARLEKQRLPLNLTRASLAEGRASLESLRELDPGQARAADRAYDRADKKVHDLDGRMHAGKPVDAADVADVAITARELSFRNRVLTMEAQLEALAQAATKADEGWVAYFANHFAIEFKELPGKLREQRAFMTGFRTNHNRNVVDATAKIDEPDPSLRELKVIEARKASLEFIEGHLAAYLKTQRLQQVLESAIHAIDDAGTRAVVTELIAQTALAIAMSAGAGVVAAAVGRVAATGAAVAMDGVVAAANAGRIANVAGVVAQVATDAALNTAGQKLLLGDQASWTAAFTANAAVSAALAPLSGMFARWGSSVSATEVRTAQLWAARGKMILRAGVAMTYEMVAAAAVEYVVKRAQHEKTQSLDEGTATEWLLQGAAMAVGRAISQRLSRLSERYAAVAERALYTPAQIERARALAASAEATGATAAAQEAAAEYHRLLEAEHDAVEATIAHGRGDAGQLRTVLAGNDAARAEASTVAFEELPLRLAGLEPENAGGLVWRGTGDEIRGAVEAAQRGGHEVEVVAQGDAATPWRVRIGGRDLELIEAPAGETRRARAKSVQRPTSRDDDAGQGARAGDDDAPVSAEDARSADRDTAPPERVVLAGDDTYLRAAADRALPREGYIDVVVHGTVDSFEVARLHDTVQVNHRALATYLRKQGLEGHKIRLIACSSGMHPKAIAQHLANQLQVEVLAPSDTAWIDASGKVGVGAKDRDTGRWVPYKPRTSGRRAIEIDPLEAERRERFAPEEPAERDGPVAVYEPRVDRRVKAAAKAPAELAADMGAPVVVDDTMHDGVSVRVKRQPRLFVDALVVTEIRIGRNTTLADLHAHQDVIGQVTAYNGKLGALKLLYQRFTAWRKGQPAPRFPQGSRAWVTELELTKLQQLIDSREALRASGDSAEVDRATLADEIAFLEGRRQFHEETLRSLEDAPDQFAIERPDVGAVTKEALAKGYQLPGPEVDPGARPEYYYYRHKPGNPDEFELSRMGSAPADAPAIRARVLSGQFTGFEKPAVPEGAIIPVGKSGPDVVEHVRATVGLKMYAKMLENAEIASTTMIDGVIMHSYSLRQTRSERITTDQVRGDVKAHFREPLMRHLLDPGLDDAASYARMREMTKDLPPADKGNLTEAWHLGRKVPDAKAHVEALVKRSDGDNAGKIEKRVIDAVDGATAVEVKSGAGEIDQGQLGAYLDMVLGNIEPGAKAPQIKKLRYVFTDPEGAKANLARFAAVMSDKNLVGLVSVDVYQKGGRMVTVSSAAQARAVLLSLSEG